MSIRAPPPASAFFQNQGEWGPKCASRPRIHKGLPIVARRDDLEDLAEVRRVDHVLAVCVDDAGFFDRRQHLDGLGLVHPQRLLAQDVLAGRGREQRVLEVPVVRQAQVDRVEGRSAHELVPARRGMADAGPRGELASLVRVAPEHGNDLHPLQARVHLGPELGDEPRAQHGHAHQVPAHRVALRCAASQTRMRVDLARSRRGRRRGIAAAAQHLLHCVAHRVGDLGELVGHRERDGVRGSLRPTACRRRWRSADRAQPTCAPGSVTTLLAMFSGLSRKSTNLKAASWFRPPLNKV